jgi:hypothetical protein
MLELRDDQLTLPIASEDGFVTWFVEEFMPDFLLEFYETLDYSILLERARYGRNKALSFGFKNPVSHTHFVWLMWEIGPDFYTFPGYKAIVEDQQKSEIQRVDSLYTAISNEQHRNAMLNGKEQAWLSQDHP